MSDNPERGAPARLGRYGRPVRHGTRITLGGLAVAGLLALIWHRGDPILEPVLPPQAGPDTIAPTAGMQFITFPPAQATAQTGGGGPVMPADTAMPGQRAGPKRVVSYAAQRQQAAPSPTDPASAAAPRPPGSVPGVAADASSGRPEATQVAFPAATMPGLRAGPAIDTTLTMMPGLYAIVLDTPINSEREGSFFAHLPRPIRSPAGVVLMEKDSRIWGHYKSEVNPGQGRVVSAVAWGMTPQGVPVPLGDATAADGSGRAGMPGVVNTHWGARVGSALTLMVTQGAVQAASAALQASLARGGGNAFFNLNSGGIDAAIAAAVRGGAAIQNTVDVEAGKEITFMLTTPISFADAYRLAPTGGVR